MEGERLTSGVFCLIERIPSFITSGLNYTLLWGGRGGRVLGKSREREKEKYKNIYKKNI